MSVSNYILPRMTGNGVYLFLIGGLHYTEPQLLGFFCMKKILIVMIFFQLLFCFFKQKTAYEIVMCLEFRRVLFRSQISHLSQFFHHGKDIKESTCLRLLNRLSPRWSTTSENKVTSLKIVWETAFTGGKMTTHVRSAV